MPIAPGSILDLRSDRYSKIEAAAINAWGRGLPFTQATLLTAIEDATGIAINAGNATYYLGQLERRGQYVSQPAKFGAKGLTKASGRPTTPYIINIGELDVAATTLRHAVEPYLNDPAVVSTRKHALRSALRFNLALSEQCSEEQVLRACEAVPATRLYGLPRQVRELALARPLAKKTAQNHAAAIAQALRYAGEHRLVPIVFPRYVEQDAWAAVLERYWPLPETGRASGETIARRRAWYAFSAMAKEVLAESMTPDLLTRDDADRVVEALNRHGRLAVANNVRTMLRRLASTHCAGPYVGETAIDSFLVDTATGPRSAIMLRGGGPGWDGLIACLRDHGFPTPMIDYLEWYGVYITMPTDELLAHLGAFPHRRKAHRLGTAALDGRAQSLRAYFGAALYELQLDAGSLTPTEAFGYQSQRIVGALIGWWNRRRQVLEAGSVGSAQAASLHRYIIGASMMAYTLYEKLRFERRLSVAERKSASGRTVLVDRREEEGAAKTADEQALWDAYTTGTGTAEDLKASAMERLGVSEKGGVPEIRDIHRILEQTGPEWWVALLNALIAEFRKAKSKGEDTSLNYHRLVQTAYEIGFYISTGCRNEEGCITRLDLHYTPEFREKRQVSFSGRDRKNLKQTRVALHSDYIPDDLREEYETRTRAFFMGDKHRVKGRPAVADHPFLFVNEKGKPYGYYYEEMDAVVSAVRFERRPGESETAFVLRVEHERQRVRERFERPFRQRAGRHGQRLRGAMARYAVELKMPLPAGRYEFGLHPLRIACGYAIYLLEGIGAAAAYLGDTEKTTTDNYSAINGINVDSRCLLAAANTARDIYRQQRHAPMDVPSVGESMTGARAHVSAADRITFTQRDTAADQPTSVRGYAAQLSELLDAKRRGEIDDEDFALAKADLKAQHRRAPALRAG